MLFHFISTKWNKMMGAKRALKEKHFHGEATQIDAFHGSIAFFSTTF
jgi:hypothetical protein